MIDAVNSLFVFCGGLFTWRNALQLYREKDFRGVYWPTSAFFTLWGIWNLFYYPSLGQWFSFWAGITLVLGNLAWVLGALSVIRARRRALDLPNEGP